MRASLGIDHPLILVHDIEAAAARYRGLGFNTAPTGKHPWGTSTSLIMFDRSALELMGIYDPALLDSHAIGSFSFGRHMEAALAQREGVSLVALYSQDAPADRTRVEAAGIQAQGRVDFRRRVKVPGREWDEAVVTLEILLDPELPRASNFLCQQHRPELVWVPEWLHHPNGAQGFANITYAAPDPAPLLARLNRLFGPENVRETASGHEATTARGTITVVRPGEWARVLGVPDEPGIEGDAAACIGIDIRVASLAVVDGILRANGVDALATPAGIVLPDHSAFGHVLLRFVEPALAEGSLPA